MMLWLLLLLVAATTFTIYLIWVRPVLMTRPSFKEFYARQESLWGALQLKFRGLKQKITTALVTIAGVSVFFYDTLAPLIAQSGVDVPQLLPMVPPKLWPLIGIGITALMLYFRNLAERRRDAEQGVERGT